MLGLMVGCKTSKEIWTAIETNFTSQSIAKQMHYKLQLQTLKKGNMSMREYLGKIKGFCDVLASVGQKISDRDHMLHIISGLGNEYDSVMVTIASRIPPYTVMEVQALLLSFESILESLSPVYDSQPMENVALNNNARNAQHIPQNSQNFRGRFGYNMRGRGKNSFRGGYRGRGRNCSNFNSRIICHICHGTNHGAEKCWYRYDNNYHGPKGNQSQQNMNRNPVLNHFQTPFPPSFNQTTFDVGTESFWYSDSGASHHVSNDMSNLSIASEYMGNNRLQMGNGAGPSNSGNTLSRDL